MSQAEIADLDALEGKKCLPPDLKEDLHRNLIHRKRCFAARLRGQK
jgi:hypothetical protein